mmetsp:Transcript_37735/g.121700  ORF Transcript_37735/g.121700 Transcript_37735/m.121700 type:complete len:302 (-) Transcript_37735:308-1213(-)
MAVEGERPLSEFYEEEFEAEKVRTSILAESAERLSRFSSEDIKIEDAVKARTRHDQHAAYEEVLGNLKAAGISPADLVEYYAFNYAEEETRSSVLLDEPTTRASEGAKIADAVAARVRHDGHGGYEEVIGTIKATADKVASGFTGKEEYHFGDLSKAAAQKITGKEDYKFGDLSKAAVGKIGDLAQYYSGQYEEEQTRSSVLAEESTMRSSEGRKVSEAVAAKARHDGHDVYETAIARLRSAGLVPSDLAEFYGAEYAAERTRTSVLAESAERLSHVASEELKISDAVSAKEKHLQDPMSA